MASYSVYDVYTPTKPAILTFVERELINDRLVDAIRTPGKQVVVFGHSGSGKTTLLINKLNQTYEDHVTTRCMAGVKFDSLVIDAFDQLDKYYTSELSSKESAKEASSLGGEYLRIKASISEELSLSTSEKKVRLLPVQLTVQRLARFMGEAKCCWVLEDFHKVDASEKVKLSQTMKVFMDMAYEYPSVKIVAIGAVGTAREVVEYDQEMRNRVSEIHVPLMNDDELKEIIVRGASCLNIRFDEITQLRVISYCNGLASVCHQLCLNLCFGAGVVQTVKIETNVNTSCLEGALKRYIE